MLSDTHKDFQRYRLSDHFVYESYDEKSKLFFNRGSIGFVLSGWPIVGASLQAQGEVAEFLKEEDNIPAGTSLQVMMLGSSDIDPYLDHWSSKRTTDIFKTLAAKRTKFLARRAKEQGTIKDMSLLISLTVPTKNTSDEQIIDMQRRRDVLISTLESIGILANNVSSEQLLKTLRMFFGWRQEDQPDLNPHQLLSEQLLANDFNMQVNSEYLLCSSSSDPDSNSQDIKSKSTDNHYAIATLEVAKRPANWSLSMMDLFLGNEMRKGEHIAADFIQSFTLQVLPNQPLEKSSLIAKRESLMKNLKSGLLKWMPNLESEYADMDAAVIAMQGGDRIVMIHQNIILKSKAPEIKKHIFQYRSMMRRNGFHFVPCNNDHLPVLLSAMPMAAVEEVSGYLKSKIGGLGPELSSLGRGIKTVSGEAKALLPIIGEWKGDLRSPGLILSGRRGQIMYWSPFGPVLIANAGKTPESNENFNLCIAGVPGSGKSVFMQELMLSTLGVGGKVFVLDYGRSFKRTCQILGGNYIEFDLKQPISLNPFSEVPEQLTDMEAREDALAGISAVLSTMAAPMAGTNDLQNAMLQKALRAVWDQKQSKAEITDIANWLLARDESYAVDLGNMLFPFTRDGIYGKFFTGPANISLNSQIVVIETDHLRNVPALLSVVVQMMIVHINQAMVKGSRKQPFLIMIDEAWKLLQGKSSGGFIEEVGRIARKYKGSITLATQQLTDYFRAESPAAEKAFENASWKVILKQNPETLLALRSNPKLAAFVKEDWQLDLMRSIHSNPPHYSEAAIFGPDVKGVVARLMLDPFTLLLTSTNAEDYDALESRVKNGMSASAAIEDVLKARGIK
jgi:conjugal transfer ATP-binding protein TraC